MDSLISERGRDTSVKLFFIERGSQAAISAETPDFSMMIFLKKHNIMFYLILSLGEVN